MSPYLTEEAAFVLNNYLISVMGCMRLKKLKLHLYKIELFLVSQKGKHRGTNVCRATHSLKTQDHSSYVPGCLHFHGGQEEVFRVKTNVPAVPVLEMFNLMIHVLVTSCLGLL